MILVVLSVSILSGYGFKALVGRFRRRNFAAAFVSALILFEFLAVPVYMSDIGVPEVYQNLSLDDGDYAILEVPVPPLYIPYGSATFIWGINEFEYYQTVHNKRVIGGYCDRIPSTAMDVLRKDPLFTVFNTPPFNATLSSDEALITLKKYDIRYVLVHRTLFRNQVYTNETYLQKINDLMLNISKPVYDDGDIIAYEIT